MSQLAVIFGGPSGEHDVSVLTGLQACRALMDGGHKVLGIYWGKGGSWHAVQPDLEAEAFLQGVPDKAIPLTFCLGADGGFFQGRRRAWQSRRLDFDAAVICCHGGPGEDGTLQSALDLSASRYTGPSMTSAALGMDKLAFGAVVAQAGLSSLPRALLTVGTEPLFSAPYVVKPRYGGSSIGVEVVADLATAYALLATSVHLRRGAVIEPLLANAYDLNIAVRAFPDLTLSTIERPTKTIGAVPVLTYSEKYVGGDGMAGAPRQIPAEIPDSIEKEIRNAARAAAELIGVRGVARIDFLCDGDSIYLNEINTIPGSMARYLWTDPAIPFLSLLEDMVSEAVSRPAFITTTEGADGTILRSARSIGSKLG